MSRIKRIMYLKSIIISVGDKVVTNHNLLNKKDIWFVYIKYGICFLKSNYFVGFINDARYDKQINGWIY